MKQTVIISLILCLSLLTKISTGTLSSTEDNESSSSISLLTERQNENTISSFKANANWVRDMNSDGSFKGVNYTTGCEAQRADWPAPDHWVRTAQLATAWVQSGDANLLNSSRRAANYWFSHTYQGDGCTRSGGTQYCPCGTPGLWNTNWYAQVIRVPSIVGPYCLLLKSKGVKLTEKETKSCQLFLSRSWNTIDKWTGANLLAVANSGIYLGLFNSDFSVVKLAFQKAYSGVVISPGKLDGTKSDGSFFQHSTLLYSGGYGQSFVSNVFEYVILSHGIKELSLTEAQQNAISIQVVGSEWMAYYSPDIKKNNWDPSVCGRFFASVQKSAVVPLSVIKSSTSGWRYAEKLANVAKRMNSTGNSVNPGKLVGNRMFWKSDYMVQRSPHYIVSLKMYSSRNYNTECINSQNLQGYWQSAGVLLTFTSGTEYRDLPPVWNWKRLPGITSDPSGSKLTCQNTKVHGQSAFVGGVSDGSIGAAVMNFADGNLSYQKSWYFFEDCYFVIVSNIVEKDQNKVYTVLDSREYKDPFNTNSGSNGKEFKDPTWMFNDQTGYLFPTSVTLNVNRDEISGEWSSIGVGFGKGKVTKQVFEAYLDSGSKKSLGYVAFPGTNSTSFAEVTKQKSNFKILATSIEIHAVHHVGRRTFGLAFKKARSYNVTSINQITSDAATVLMLDNKVKGSVKVTIADPTQLLTSTTITIVGPNLSCGSQADCKRANGAVEISFKLPTLEKAGSSVSATIQGDLHL